MTARPAMNASPPVTIIMYHYVRPIADSPYPGIKGLELSLFREQLAFLNKHYQIVSMEALIESIADGGAGLPPKPALLTFDDGYVDHYQHAFPVLFDMKLPGAFYAPSGAVLERRMLEVNKIHFILISCADHGLLVADIERQAEAAARRFDLKPMSAYREQYWAPTRNDVAETVYIKRMLQVALPGVLRTEIIDNLFRTHVTEDEKSFADELYADAAGLRDMAANGMHIGGHGYAHAWLSEMTREEQEIEIDRALDILDAIGAPRTGFSYSYAYGERNTETLELMAERGCAVAMIDKPGLATVDPSAMYELPRLDTNEFPKDAAAAPNHWYAVAESNGGRAN